MKLISARQAWHDALYNESSSPLAKAAEMGRLGTHIQQNTYFDSNQRAAHIALSGRVQCAIASLPEELQQLGHWLYAPLTIEETNRLVDDVQDTIFKRSKVDQDDNTIYWLTRAAMSDYQDIVLGREQQLKTPARIRQYLASWHGIEINTRRWAREWQPTWQKLWHTLNDLDAQALRPVAWIVYKEKDAA